MNVLLDVALLDALLVQVLDELLPFHPVDERTGVSAVAEEGSACQVDRTSCGPHKNTEPSISFKNGTNHVGDRSGIWQAQFNPICSSRTREMTRRPMTRLGSILKNVQKLEESNLGTS